LSAHLFDLLPVPVVPVTGTDAVYPVGRIFCVGRNYEAHAKEMGVEADREAPFYFTKTPSAACGNNQTVPYPPGTKEYHHEMELVVALGADVFRANAQQAAAAIFGYGCGLDMTRRDLQQAGKDKRRPWDLGKDVENAAVFAPLTPAAEVGEIGPQRIHMSINGDIRQDAHLSDLIHSVIEVIVDLSKYYHLRQGDLIMTGTPAGVGPVSPGDLIEGGIDGLVSIVHRIGEPE
jgi:fumarylpyruvate hydrolase